MKELICVEHKNQGSHQSISTIITKCYQRKISILLLKTQTMYVFTVKDIDKPKY